MDRKRKIFAAKSAVVLGVIPALIWAYQNGPDPRKTGAPGDGLCSEAGCHVGTPNSGGGRVEVIFPSGTTYTPGQTQRLEVRVTDSAARVYGYQLTARLASNERSAQAGTFRPIDSLSFVLCEDGSTRPASGSCRAQTPLEFIEHARPNNTNTFSFDWTPPATDQGNVRIWVAANAGNGNGQADSGDRIYAANYTLTPAAGGGNRPAFTQAGIVSPFINRAVSNIATGTWVEIYGANLSTNTRQWAGGDFNGNTAPTSLDGVTVNFNGQPAAAMNFISPGQVNAQVPDVGAGPVSIEVVNGQQRSDAVTMTALTAVPTFLSPASFNVGDRQWLVAIHQDRAFVGRPNLIAGAQFRPARPGDVILVYGIGFGATTPAVPPGQIASGLPNLNSPFTFRFGDTPAEVSYAGLAPGFVGLYQFNIVVPNVPDGDYQINATLGGTPINQMLFLTVQR